MDKAEWEAALQAAYEQDEFYQEERDGCPICGGALKYDDNGDLIPCEGTGRIHEEWEAKRKKITVEEAAVDLRKFLQSDANLQTIGLRKNNIEAYNKNPQRFAELITKDSMICYTYNEPTKAELDITSWHGYKVEWKKAGFFVVG